jgi:hypothetical protein
MRFIAAWCRRSPKAALVSIVKDVFRVETDTHRHHAPIPDALYRLIPDRAGVLDIDFAAIDVAQALRDEKHCRLVGVGRVPAPDDSRRSHYHQVETADISAAGLSETIGHERFDVVVIGDALQRVPAARELLELASGLLEPGGAVVARVANVSHASIRLGLLAGEFRYTADGPLHDGYVRLFTLTSIRDLLDEVGLVPAAVHRSRTEGETPELAQVPPQVRDLILADPEATVTAYLIKAFRSQDIDRAAHRALSEAVAAVGFAEQLEEQFRGLRQDGEAARQALEVVQDRAEALEQELIEVRSLLSVVEDDLDARNNAYDELVNAHRKLEAAYQEVERSRQEMAATRVWRLGSTWWRLRDRLRGR